VLRRGLVYSFWLGMASSVSWSSGGPAFMHAIGLPKDLADGASLPLIVFSLSLPGYGLSVAATFWLEGLSKPGPAAWAMWAANVVNLGIDLLLVPGPSACRRWARSAAPGPPTGARTFLALATLGYIALDARGARPWAYSPSPSRTGPAAITQRRIGYGAGVSNFFEVAAFASLNVIAGWMGASGGGGLDHRAERRGASSSWCRWAWRRARRCWWARPMARATRPA
jgi:MATE family multidrug resistance protein